jgi:hypothetical protein
LTVFDFKLPIKWISACEHFPNIIPPQKVNSIILEELLYKFHNFNDVEFIATLNPKIAEKSLDKLI